MKFPLPDGEKLIQFRPQPGFVGGAVVGVRYGEAATIHQCQSREKLLGDMIFRSPFTPLFGAGGCQHTAVGGFDIWGQFVAREEEDTGIEEAAEVI